MKTSKALDLIDTIRLTYSICTESNGESVTSVFARSQYKHGSLHSRSCVSVVHDRKTGKTRLRIGERVATVSSFKSHLAQVSADFKKGFLERPK